MFVVTASVSFPPHFKTYTAKAVTTNGSECSVRGIGLSRTYEPKIGAPAGILALLRLLHTIQQGGHTTPGSGEYHG
jgi:hypothetical protein